MVISKGLLVLGMVFGMAAGGVVDRVVDVYKTCRKEADLVESYRCALGAQRLLLDVRECPGVTVYVGPDTLVTAFQGTAEAVTLARTTLGCRRSDGCINQCIICKFIYLFILLTRTHYFTKFVKFSCAKFNSHNSCGKILRPVNVITVSTVHRCLPFIAFFSCLSAEITPTSRGRQCYEHEVDDNNNGK